MADENLQSTIQIIIDSSTPTPTTTKQPHNDEPSGSSILERVHAGYFRISVSLGSQALLWKILSHHANQLKPIHHLFHSLPSTTFLLLWWFASCTLILLSLLYVLKCIFHFPLVKSEFLHHVGVNFFFAPWISWLLLLQSVPSSVVINHDTLEILMLIFVVPILLLDLKIYGQWFTTERRFLSLVANPTSQMTVIGNLVAAWTAAQMGWKESAIGLFTLGASHYLIVFVTLYQRFSGSDRFPAMLRPAFFLFVAAPSTASLAWGSVSGSFTIFSEMLFFLSLYLFASLICRPMLFKKSMKTFNVAWWAYSFPLTFLALASAQYSQQIKGPVAAGLMLFLSAISVVVLLGLMAATAINADTLIRGADPVLKFTSDQGTT